MQRMKDTGGRNVGHDGPQSNTGKVLTVKPYP